MAPLQSFLADPATVQPAGTVTLTAIFDLSAGQADETLTGELRDALGAVVGTATITLDNPDAEPDPEGLTVVVRNSGGTAVGQVTGFTGTRDGDTYTAVWTWVAP